MTCASLADCILTLPNGVPFRHMFSGFALDTFTPLFSKASLHCSNRGPASCVVPLLVTVWQRSFSLHPVRSDIFSHAKSCVVLLNVCPAAGYLA